MSFSVLAAWVLLAQQAGDATPPPIWWVLGPPLLILVPLYWLMVIQPEKKRQAERKAKLDGIEKYDRVVTAGGIKGVVEAVDRKQQEVTLVIDEKTGTTMRVTLASVVDMDLPEDAEAGEKHEKKK
ncbi:MAG: preprotein translocase subunit YajC [Planctomycetota bacterium]|nr:MAG: preprotein translocase subunit YajC [Planctomycetota bacterium]REJ89224.1 MAG: preprotein translocase subunit YajC [Planctomycetota bacterium]REK17713.1 MAG: preprotein translocase subunit YajC [Planctomycetota bacterium]REK46766.1 MAG: preprotein translocase subunit YajC [Planctomycetota bacterium]